MPSRRERALLSWSSGKDSAHALHALRRSGDIEVVGLLTTLNAAFDRVAMHGVRHELLAAQARAAGIELRGVPLPWPCSNDEYEALMGDVIAAASAEGITLMAFGDLFLAEFRSLSRAAARGPASRPSFRSGPSRPTGWLGRCWPPDCEPGWPASTQASQVGSSPDGSSMMRCSGSCRRRSIPAENGEFHTFALDGPEFSEPIAVRTGEVVERDGFVFADLLPAE